MEIKTFLNDWKKNFFLPPQTDVLLQLHARKNTINLTDDYAEEKSFFVSETTQLKKTFTEHQKSIKEIGSPIFGILKDVFKFYFENKEYEMPFLLADASIKKNRFNGNYEIRQTEDFYINPMLLQILGVKNVPEDTEEAKFFLEQVGLKISCEKGIWGGNFHLHRFVLQKEFDELLHLEKYSETLKSLFGIESTSETVKLSPSFLFSADEQQIEAMKTVETENCVLQGPPGTGKSQVIANIIGKTIGNHKKNLIVAEKSVALKVIYDLLSERNLHPFCLFYEDGLKSKNLLNSLEKTWKFIEQLPVFNPNIMSESELMLDGLNLSLSRLKQEDLIGGISFSEFISFPDFSKKSTYLVSKPEIKTWQKDKVQLMYLAEKKFPIYGSWLKLKTGKKNAQERKENGDKIRRMLQEIPFENLTPTSLKIKIKLSHLASLFFVGNKPLPTTYFLNDDKKQKKITLLIQQLKTLKEKEKLLSDEKKNWKKDFSLSEIEEYLTAFQTKGIFNYRAARTRKKLKKQTDLSLLNVEKPLKNLLELHKIKLRIIAVQEKLRKLGFPDDLLELQHILYVIQRIQSIDKNDFKKIADLTEIERENLVRFNKDLIEINQILKSDFSLNEEEHIKEQIEQIQSDLSLYAEFQSSITQIDEATKSALKETASLEETEQAIYYSHWIDFKGRFPNLAEMKEERLQEKLNQILDKQIIENEEFGKFIQQKIKEQFENYHILLQTPATKLSTTEKEQKKRLRKGKSMLIKAFNKKRNLPSVRELLESEAEPWIRLLHPVFLCSPYAVAKNLPINLQFDIGVFDEASQIPLGNILGSVQRSKRVIICGDQQQMPPSFYFQKKEKYRSDALHHAEFYWKNKMLTYHYRAQHPKLIAFSNQYFYENKLKTFPGKNVGNPIELVTIDGEFVDRINKKEAEWAAKMIAEKIKKGMFDFGLVTFSQKQLQAVIEKIPKELLFQLEGKNKVFMQSLENVQGDQCEHLIISLGYAKNETGDFHLRFGPLNLEQGYRRLNVLMSRASKKITFIRSVTANNFPISDNNGVEMLRKLMLFLEKNQTETINSWLPPHCRIEKEEICFENGIHHFKTARELLDNYRIYKERGWKIQLLQ